MMKVFRMVIAQVHFHLMTQMQIQTQFSLIFQKRNPSLSLQYRHANLNSYLHGPSYALGNSYASTQVARHRSWGRVQMIQHEPTVYKRLNRSNDCRNGRQAGHLYRRCKEPRSLDIGECWAFPFHNWGKKYGGMIGI